LTATSRMHYPSRHHRWLPTRYLPAAEAAGKHLVKEGDQWNGGVELTTHL
jgi:hypothetical protein